MREDNRLSALLAELANDDAAARPRANLEAHTLAAWDAWQEKRSAPRAVRYRSAALVVGLGGLVAALIVILAVPRASTGSKITASVVAPGGAMAPSSGSSTESVSDVSGQRDAAVAPVAVRPRRPPAAVAVVARPSAPAMVSGETTSFVPLGPDVDRELSGSFQLARVQVPRDVLVDLGLLTDAYRGGEPVQADVMFGEDGMAKAIRLVSTSRRIR